VMKAVVTLHVISLICFISLLFVIVIKPVAAEDDCNFGTWKVMRIPVVGLVCVINGEPL
jgi:hypothetical protein